MQAQPSGLHPQNIAGYLEANRGTFRALTNGLSDAELRWRPAQGGWSVLECLHHMLDEERRDFRVRIKLVLEDPEQTWPSIDPEGWVLAERYNEADREQVLRAFEAERADSVRWLRQLEELDLEPAYEHPQLGTQRVGDLLTAWMAHDQLHLSQLTRLRVALLKQACQPYNASYAGA